MLFRGNAFQGSITGRLFPLLPGALEHKRAEVRRLFGTGSRLHQIVTWLGGPKGDGECLIVLDECHKAKNLLDAAGSKSVEKGAPGRKDWGTIAGTCAAPDKHGLGGHRALRTWGRAIAFCDVLPNPVLAGDPTGRAATREPQRGGSLGGVINETADWDPNNLLNNVPSLLSVTELLPGAAAPPQNPGQTLYADG
jgi:hypothetical protein